MKELCEICIDDDGNYYMIPVSELDRFEELNDEENEVWSKEDCAFSEKHILHNGIIGVRCYYEK